MVANSHFVLHADTHEHKFVFNVSVLLFSQVPTLRCKVQTQKSLKNYNSGLGFRLGATYFLTLCEIATLVWAATHTMDLIAYFTSRCKVRCVDESRGARWDGWKNEVITFSPDAKINTAGSTSSGEVQTAMLIGFAKQKRKL